MSANGAKLPQQVIDTNVLVVAEESCSSVGQRCLDACISYLVSVRESASVLVDDSYRILREYERNLQHAGQPKTGLAFYKWLCTNVGSSTVYVHITPIPGPDEDYVEFPHTPGLAGFDPSDRKFVAVALASGLNPPIANATDSDWADYHGALTETGVTVEFLCPDDCAPQQ